MKLRLVYYINISRKGDIDISVGYPYLSDVNYRFTLHFSFLFVNLINFCGDIVIG